MNDVLPADEMTLLELLDRVVDKGVILQGELTVSVADIDLLYIGLQAVISSTAHLKEGGPTGPSGASSP